MATLTCPRCGTVNPDGSMTCRKCRINLQWALDHANEVVPYPLPADNEVETNEVETRTCPKCGGAMAKGWTPDYLSAGIAQSRWVDGEPHRSSLWGIRINAKEQSTYLITIFRCEACGYLESYARTQVVKS